MFKGTAQGFFVAWFGWPIRMYKKATACREKGTKLIKTRRRRRRRRRKVYSKLTQEVEGLFVANKAKEEEK